MLLQWQKRGEATMERWRMSKNNSEMMIYTTEDGLTKIETTFDGDTVWLSVDQMADLFQRDKSAISDISRTFSLRRIEARSSCCKFCNNCR